MKYLKCELQYYAIGMNRFQIIDNIFLKTMDNDEGVRIKQELTSGQIWSCVQRCRIRFLYYL